MICNDLRLVLHALDIVRGVAADDIAPALASIADVLSRSEAQLRRIECAAVPPHWLRQPSNPTDWPENVTALRRGMV